MNSIDFDKIIGHEKIDRSNILLISPIKSAQRNNKGFVQLKQNKS